EFADIARERDLGGTDIEGLGEGLREVFLRVDVTGANQLEDLAVPETFVHRFHSARRASASSSAAATAAGPVPPGSSRGFMPSVANRRRVRSGVNSGAKAASSAAVQSEGFFSLRTLSRTSFPTSWCAR